MTLEDQKTGIISQVQKTKSEADLLSALKLAVRELQVHYKMAERTLESVASAEQGNTLSLDEFQKGNKAWIKERFTK